MPSLFEVILSLLTMVGLGVLIAPKGDRVWAAVIAVCAWFLMEFVIVAAGFLNAWSGLLR